MFCVAIEDGFLDEAPSLDEIGPDDVVVVVDFDDFDAAAVRRFDSSSAA